MLFRDESLSFSGLGNSPVTVKNIAIMTASINPAELAANSSAETDVTLAGVGANDIVIAQVPASLEVGLAFSGIRVKAAGTVALRLSNVTGSAVDGAARTWTFLVIQRG
jgi:hypothetical protein